jgi:hypothetical protein
MADNAGYPVVRAVFILLIAAVLIGDVVFLVKMGGDVLGVAT